MELVGATKTGAVVTGATDTGEVDGGWLGEVVFTGDVDAPGVVVLDLGAGWVLGLLADPEGELEGAVKLE